MNTIIYRTKRDKRKNSIFFGFQFPHSVIYNGFTLIELLVVMSIMVLLVAASVPLLKPMFESQKTKNAAQTVAAAIQRVRFKAMEEQAACGILFERFAEEAPNVSLRMRLLKSGNAYINPPDVRAKVIDSTITFFERDDTSGKWSTLMPSFPGENTIKEASSIQFGRQGRFYPKEEGSLKLTNLNGFNLPENGGDDAMEFKVLQPPRVSLTPPVVLPRGTVVDLTFSAGCTGAEKTGDYNENKKSFEYKNTTIKNGIKIYFTPAGYVDEFYIDDVPHKPYGGLIYLCIGEWERGLNLAEDGKNNIETMTNFWVTLNPQTGQVRITEMAPNSGDVQDARRFAAEHYGIHE
jgi:prepilin-type N-terminal cleavage/methylation domain-containing protein